MKYQAQEIAGALDYAVLRPIASVQEVETAARLAYAKGFACLCVASYNVSVAKPIMPRVCAVIGFPHGNMSPRIKYEEAAQAIEDGAVELDVVINYGRFLEGHTITVVHELSQILVRRTPPAPACSSRPSWRPATIGPSKSSPLAACVWTAAWTS